MARVHLLEDELINKIAAGEVVERPASVVKELVENAIDAGATHVKVSLRDGGRALIQVQDDGSGMDPEDAVMAVKRHTTSKLLAADDLFQVKTMGFRGEALASIASVSRFTLQTQTRDQHGYRVQIEDGKQTGSPWQGSPGTMMTVAELFYNVPARRAFLKTAAAEFAACHEYMQALALSLPGLGFTLLHNDREIFAVSPALKAEGPLRGEVVMRTRAAAIIGSEDAERLIYVQRPDRHGFVEALISPPGLDRASARHCFTFVNGRWVRDKLLRFAVQRGYHSHLMKGKFPIAVVYLTVDPALVDVNVHPTKAELRFQYAQEVQNCVVYAIRDALRDGTWASAHPPIRTATSAPQTTSEVMPEDFDLYLPQSDETKSTVMRFEGQEPKSEPRAGAETARPSARPSSSPMASPSRSQGGASAPGSANALRSSDASKHSGMTAGDMRSPTNAGLSAGDGRSSATSTNAGLSAGREGDLRSPETAKDSDLSPAKRDEAQRSSKELKDSSGSVPAAQNALSHRDMSSRSNQSSSAGQPSSLDSARGTSQSHLARAASDRSKTTMGDAGHSTSTGSTTSQQASALPRSALASPRVSSVPSPDGQTTIPWVDLTYIGPFARCFLLFEYQQQMLAIDQHAFHERVLYERLIANPDILRRSQPLLMPEVLDFSPTECERLMHIKDALAALGIQIQGVSETEIEVTAVPSLLMNKDLNSLLAAILGGKDQASELAHDVLATMACHAAVRAGEELPEADLKVLLREAETVDFYHNCPHGRRVFRWWKLAQVAAWFDR